MLATGKLANARKIRTSVSPEPALAFVLFIVLLRLSMSDKRSQANFQIFPFLEGRCLQRLEASQTPLGAESDSPPPRSGQRDFLQVMAAYASCVYLYRLEAYATLKSA